MYVLPKTGLGALMIGGVALANPTVAAIGGGLILAGLLAVRFARPIRVGRSR